MDYDDILIRYTQIRDVTRQLNFALPELLSKATIEHAAKQLGIWVKGSVVLDHMDQGAVLMDYAIHDCRVDGRNAVERYLAQHPPVPQSEEETILGAMQRAYYSLFQIETVVPGVGVHVHDMFREERHFLADVGFSQSAVKGLVAATRVFPFADFLMTAGAALAPDADAMEAITRLPWSARPRREIANLAPEARADLNAAIIRLCLQTQNTARVAYQGMNENEGEEPAAVLPSQRVGRNEPCLCGSGKKYKKCCGR